MGASSEEAAEVVADASVALDWKWGYGDGNLACWRPEELAEFLLEWCTRKLSVPQDECGGLPAALQALLGFLASSDLLDTVRLGRHERPGPAQHSSPAIPDGSGNRRSSVPPPGTQERQNAEPLSPQRTGVLQFHLSELMNAGKRPPSTCRCRTESVRIA